MSTRIRYTAEYSFPGLLFPETTSRAIEHGDLYAAVAEAPAGDHWYAVTITAIHEKRFVADDGEEAWVKTGTERVGRYVIGEKVHYSEIPPDGERGPGGNRILIANIKANSADGYGVKTRCGNWQIASDYDDVIAPQAVS